MPINTSKSTQNIFGQLIAQNLNPLQDNVLKTVKKIQSKQIEEAVDQGVPVENILQQSQIPIVSMDDSLKLNKALAGDTPQGGISPKQANQVVSQLPGDQQVLDTNTTQQTQAFREPEVLPAKSLFSRAEITPEGDLREAGFFGAILNPSADQLLARRSALRAQQTQGINAQTNALNALTAQQRLSLEQKKLALDLQKQPLQNRLTEAKAKNQEFQAEVLQRFFQDQGGLQGGNLPPGAKITVGGLQLPLNPDLSADEARIVSSAGIVDESVQELLTAVDSGQLDSFFNQAIVDLGNPLIANEKLDFVISAMNALKGIVPFAKGGKQLTPFESKLLFRLLDTKGKSKKVIRKDLVRFQREFMKLFNATTGGVEGAKQPVGNARTRSVIQRDNAGRTQSRQGGTIMVDANGNRARVFPDGTFIEEGQDGF
jgi:hypothetical protein